MSHPIEVGALSSYLTGMRISRDCFANFIADFLFRSAVFILDSKVCNLRIGIVHYKSTNVKRIVYALYSFTDDFNPSPPEERYLLPKPPTKKLRIPEKISHVASHLNLG